MSDLIERLVRLTNYWNERDALTGFKAVEMACETIVVTNSAAWRIKQLEERIAELESEVARLRVGHDRYEIVRRMNAIQFAELFKKSIRTNQRFDDLVDAAKEQS